LLPLLTTKPTSPNHMAFSNPFSRSAEGTRRNITAYRILTLVSWIIQFVTTWYYFSNAPTDGKHHHTLFGWDATPFSLNSVFVGLYWIVLWILQLVYVWHLFQSDEVAVDSAAAVGSHFISYNLLQFAWVMLWTRGHTVIAEIFLLVNFFNLLAAYLRYPTAPRLIHLPVSAMPLTFTFFMILWDGAIMVHCHSTLCRILANIAIWSIPLYAGTFLLVFKDYYVGFATAFLAAGLGVGQFFTKVVALQWPFAFAVMAIVFVFSLVVAIPGILGRDSGAEASGRSGERAPLLREGA